MRHFEIFALLFRIVVKSLFCLDFCCYGFYVHRLSDLFGLLLLWFLCVSDDVTLALLTGSELERCILDERCYGIYICVPDDVTLALLTGSELGRCILVPRASRLFLNYITFQPLT